MFNNRKNLQDPHGCGIVSPGAANAAKERLMRTKICVKLSDSDMVLLKEYSSSESISPEEYAKGVLLGTKPCIHPATSSVKQNVRKILIGINDDFIGVLPNIPMTTEGVAILDRLESLQGRLSELEKVLDLY